MAQTGSIDVANYRSEARKPGFRTQIIRGVKLLNRSIGYGYDFLDRQKATLPSLFSGVTVKDALTS
jgi:hypothetical protein